MKLTAFRVLNYRCVNDSGWIDLEDLTVLVGKNQSGKTALLKALHKFNPFQNDPYNMDREWPRGRRKDRDPNSPAIMVRFALTEEEQNALSKIGGSPEYVEITRAYDGSRAYTFPEGFDPDKAIVEKLLANMRSGFAADSAECSETFRLALNQYAAELVKLTESRDFARLGTALQSTQQQLGQRVSNQEPDATQDSAALQQVVKASAGIVQICPRRSAMSELEEQIAKWLPVFVYMDDYRQYRGATFLNQLKERQEQNKLTEEDETVLVLMKMAGLDLNDQAAKASATNKEQRALDLNDASVTLTREMAGRWSQAQYEVQFHADGHHFMTFVRSPGQASLVPLEEESKGFQWFFSFDIHFAYQTRGTLKGAVLLLDEPGLHLHPTAQADLLRRLEAYCQGNQLIYTTHLPFMIDQTKFERIRIVDRREDGTVVTDDIFGGNKDARFSLLAKLGMSASQGLLVAQYNLVVEGPEDYWIVNGVSELFKRARRQGLDDRLQVTGPGGASEAANMATFMYGQDLNVAVLFDSDNAGERAEESLIKKWQTKYRSNRISILKVGDVLGQSQSEATIEDLLGEEYYLPFVEQAYQKELAGQKLNLGNQREPQLVRRVEAALQAVGEERFNKGRPAKLIRDDLRVKDVDKLPPATVANFERLFARLRKIVTKWDARGSSNA